MSKKRKRSRSMRPKWIKGEKGKASIGRGSNQPMTFKGKAGRRPRPKGQPGRS